MYDKKHQPREVTLNGMPALENRYEVISKAVENSMPVEMDILGPCRTYLFLLKPGQRVFIQDQVGKAIAVNSRRHLCLPDAPTAEPLGVLVGSSTDKPTVAQQASGKDEAAVALSPEPGGIAQWLASGKKH